MKRYMFLFLLLGCALVVGCAKERQQAGDFKPESAHSTMTGDDAQEGLPESPINFDVPEGWVKETPKSSSRLMQFRLPHVKEDKEDAEVAVFYFPGGGGTPQANVDRWIGQFSTPDGKPAADKAKTSHKDINGIHVTIVDVSGMYLSSMGPMQGAGEPKANYRMLGVIAETPSGPWFVKFTGPERTVAHWEPSFHSFLNSMKQ